MRRRSWSKFRRGDIARGGIYENFTKWDTGDHEIPSPRSGAASRRKMREGQQPLLRHRWTPGSTTSPAPGTEVTINSVLVYPAGAPLPSATRARTALGGGNADLFPTIAPPAPSAWWAAPRWKSKWRSICTAAVPLHAQQGSVTA